ncbi:conserved hypothetical protein [Plasmopara halstedii]|uniref:Uncharacterized protein n=1 Tax=Plasmopara halstedii TaxID=4781 RepID=A0A0P1AM90_PLAHL|nr:conserved hypothetical protein [Plasmopara halstedii]CEG42295.1 conserved hypothetical protein [Plasmopara halstedii]|eukprot:XP_024578664.1 conserved hypothetical protein [Plasmopara halstedii]
MPEDLSTHTYIVKQQLLADERRHLQQKEDSRFGADRKRQIPQPMKVALEEHDETDVSKLSTTITAIPIIQAVTAKIMKGFQPGVIGGPQFVFVLAGTRGPIFCINESKKLSRQ